MTVVLLSVQPMHLASTMLDIKILCTSLFKIQNNSLRFECFVTSIAVPRMILIIMNQIEYSVVKKKTQHCLSITGVQDDDLLTWLSIYCMKFDSTRHLLHFADFL